MAAKPSQTLETISPARAAQYLKHNTANRRIRKAKVARYAKLINEGKWKTTHQGIAFNCDGTLLDGQHRLHGIVESGKSVKMWVARHIDREAMYAVDQGIIRKPLDIIGPLGITHADDLKASHVATARAMAGGMYPGILGRNLSANSVSEWTNGDVLDYIEQHFDAIQFACSLPLGICRNATIRAVIARAWYTADRERLAKFAEVLCAGIVGNRADIGAGKLRDYFLKNGRGAGSSQVRSDLYRHCEWALVNFLEMRAVQRLHGADAERFPIPGEDA